MTPSFILFLRAWLLFSRSSNHPNDCCSSSPYTYIPANQKAMRAPFKNVSQKLHTPLLLPSYLPELSHMATSVTRSAGKYSLRSGQTCAQVKPGGPITVEERENKYWRTTCRLCYTYNNRHPSFLALPRLHRWSGSLHISHLTLDNFPKHLQFAYTEDSAENIFSIL